MCKQMFARIAYLRQWHTSANFSWTNWTFTHTHAHAHTRWGRACRWECSCPVCLCLNVCAWEGDVVSVRVCVLMQISESRLCVFVYVLVWGGGLMRALLTCLHAKVRALLSLLHTRTHDETRHGRAPAFSRLFCTTNERARACSLSLIHKLTTKRAMNSKAMRPPPVPDSTCAAAMRFSESVNIRECMCQCVCVCACG